MENPKPNILLVVALPVESYLMKDNETKEQFNERTTQENGELEKLIKGINVEEKMNIDIVYTGVGMNNASSFTSSKLTENYYSGNPFTHVISVGSCGARPDSKLNAGDVVLPNEVMNLDLNRAIGSAYNPQPHCPDEKLTVGMNTSSMSRPHDERATQPLDTDKYNFTEVIKKAKSQSINVSTGGLNGSTNMFDGPNYVDNPDDHNLKRITTNEMELAGIINSVEIYNKYSECTKKPGFITVQCLAIKYVGNVVPDKNAKTTEEITKGGQDWIGDLKEGKGQKALATVTGFVLTAISAQYNVTRR